MEFIRTQSETMKPFDIDYRLIEGDGHHPKALGLLPDDDAHEAMQQSYLAEAIACIGQEDPNLPLSGTGDVFYNAYDAEWTEIAPGVLGTLSYQFYASGTGGDLAVICYPNSMAIEDRLALADMLNEVIRLALATGCLLTVPKQQVLAGFSLRSDLAVTSDLPVYKRQLTNVGGKVATAERGVDFEIFHKLKDVQRLMTPPSLSVQRGGASFVVSTRFVDISLHAPPRAALAKLGEVLGIEKLNLEGDLPGYTKSRMDLVKRDHFDYFRRYGIRDAEITLRYWLRVVAFAQEVVGVDDAPVSAGALAVQLCRGTLTEAGLDYATLFDVYEKEVIEWDAPTGRRRSRKRWVLGDDRAFHEQFAVQGFHGGRNECYTCGPSDVDQWIDVDMVGAYTTGMVSVRRIAFRKSFETRRLKDFLGDVLGVAWIDFRYPKPIPYPGLAVRSDERGLIFPLAGQTYATAPEIALAVRQGCKIVIRRGVIWPWEDDPDDVRIFEPFVRKIRALRKAYEQDAVFEEYAKLLGNSVYGKTAQSLRDRNAFELATLDSRKIGPSAITNAAIAAHVTGFVRATIGEMLHGIPAHRTVVSATTDGFLTNAREDEIDLSGPLCQRYLDLCRRVEA